MIVDCHTHINCALDDVETSEHLASAETVDACIVLATADGPPGYGSGLRRDKSEEVNKELAEYVNKHKEKMVGFAVVEPIKDKIGVNNLKLIKDKLGLKGVRMVCTLSTAGRCVFMDRHRSLVFRFSFITVIVLLERMPFWTMPSHTFWMRLRESFRL